MEIQNGKHTVAALAKVAEAAAAELVRGADPGRLRPGVAHPARIAEPRPAA